MLRIAGRKLSSSAAAARSSSSFFCRNPIPSDDSSPAMRSPSPSLASQCLNQMRGCKALSRDGKVHKLALHRWLEAETSPSVVFIKDIELAKGSSDSTKMLADDESAKVEGTGYQLPCYC